MDRLCPSATADRQIFMNRQQRGYQLPILSTARSEFEQAMGFNVDWLEPWTCQSCQSLARSVACLANRQVLMLRSWGPVKKEKFITTLGGRIRCPRCQAKSKHSQQQCRSPAIKGKSVCKIHGGRSTGPKTQQGRNRCGAARKIHGRETRAIRAKRQQALAELKLIERIGKEMGVMWHWLLLGLTRSGSTALQKNECWSCSSFSRDGGSLVLTFLSN